MTRREVKPIVAVCVIFVSGREIVGLNRLERIAKHLGLTKKMKEDIERVKSLEVSLKTDPKAQFLSFGVCRQYATRLQQSPYYNMNPIRAELRVCLKGNPSLENTYLLVRIPFCGIFYQLFLLGGVTNLIVGILVTFPFVTVYTPIRLMCRYSPQYE